MAAAIGRACPPRHSPARPGGRVQEQVARRPPYEDILAIWDIWAMCPYSGGQAAQMAKMSMWGCRWPPGGVRGDEHTSTGWGGLGRGRWWRWRAWPGGAARGARWPGDPPETLIDDVDYLEYLDHLAFWGRGARWSRWSRWSTSPRVMTGVGGEHVATVPGGVERQPRRARDEGAGLRGREPVRQSAPWQL